MKREKGITLIALVVTIVVLLILAGVTITTLMGDNGILTKAKETTIENCHATIKDGISLKYNEYKIKVNSSEYINDFLHFLKEENCIESDGTIKVKDLIGETLILGNGTENKDVYKIEEETNLYILKYYDEKLNPEILWNVAENKDTNLKTITIYDRKGLLGQDITIQYEEGMTWKEFLNSEYNNEILEERVIGDIVYIASSFWIQDSDGKWDIIEDTIDENKSYFWASDM